MQFDDTEVDASTFVTILETFPGIKGLQSGNDELYLFTVSGSDKLWLQDKDKDEPRGSHDRKISTFRTQREMNSKVFKYWFEDSELKKYGVDINNLIGDVDLEDIIDSI